MRLQPFLTCTPTYCRLAGNNGSAPTLSEGLLNDTINPSNYPGAYPEVVAVSAVDCTETAAGFSQKNPGVDLAAPGATGLAVESTRACTGTRPVRMCTSTNTKCACS